MADHLDIMADHLVHPIPQVAVHIWGIPGCTMIHGDYPKNDFEKNIKKLVTTKPNTGHNIHTSAPQMGHFEEAGFNSLLIFKHLRWYVHHESVKKLLPRRLMITIQHSAGTSQNRNITTSRWFVKTIPEW